MYVNKWSHDLRYKSNVSRKKEKKRYIKSSLHPSRISTLPLTKMSYTNSPPKNDYFLIQNYSPFLSQVTKGKSVK